MTIHITDEITAAYRAYLDEQVDADFLGSPILRRYTYPYRGDENSGLLSFAAGFQAARNAGVKGLRVLNALEVLERASFSAEQKMSAAEFLRILGAREMLVIVNPLAPDGVEGRKP